MGGGQGDTPEWTRAGGSGGGTMVGEHQRGLAVSSSRPPGNLTSLKGDERTRKVTWPRRRWRVLEDEKNIFFKKISGRGNWKQIGGHKHQSADRSRKRKLDSLEVNPPQVGRIVIDLSSLFHPQQ